MLLIFLEIETAEIIATEKFIILASDGIWEFLSNDDV